MNQPLSLLVILGLLLGLLLLSLCQTLSTISQDIGDLRIIYKVTQLHYRDLESRVRSLEHSPKK